jgi:hypothetical protein
MSQKPTSPSRREMLRKGIYLAPLIVTLPVLPSFASSGSNGGGGHGGGGDDDDHHGDDRDDDDGHDRDDDDGHGGGGHGGGGHGGGGHGGGYKSRRRGKSSSKYWFW